MIKVFMKYILFLPVFYIVEAQPEELKKSILSVTEKNKEADRAFLVWKVHVPTVSKGLRSLLSKQGIEYLVQESQMPFTKLPTEEQMNQKISLLAAQFLKKFNPEGTVKVSPQEVQKLVREIIAPEYVFVAPSRPQSATESSYKELVETLRARHTRIGTTLEDWALRFLTSESMLLAIPILERLDYDGRGFNELTPLEQKKALQPVIDVISQRFLNNLRAVRAKFNFSLPVHTDKAIRQRVKQFLYEKFIQS